MPADGAIFAQHHCDTREAGQLYDAWLTGSPAIRQRMLEAPDLFFKAKRQEQEKAPAGTGAELLPDLEMVAAIVNRAQRRLAGAAAIELDRQQCEAARRQIDRIQKQLHRIDEEILPEKKPHNAKHPSGQYPKTEALPNVEPGATHHDSGTECAASEQTGDRAELMEERYRQHSTIISTNLVYDEWPNFLGSRPMVEALLSRLRHDCHTVAIDGPSLREPQS